MRSGQGRVIYQPRREITVQFNFRLTITKIVSSSPKREGVGGTINRVSKLCEGVAVWDRVEHELKGYLRLVQIAKALGTTAKCDRRWPTFVSLTGNRIPTKSE